MEITLGQKIDLMQQNREARRLLAAEDKELKSVYDQMEREILENLDDLDLVNARGSLASVSLKATEVPAVKDVDLFIAYVRETDSLFLLTGTPSTPACREMFQAGTAIPGIEMFTKRTLNLRTL